MSDDELDDFLKVWPASLREVETVIGLAATLKLVEAFGGGNCYIPATPDPSAHLVQVLGERAVAALIEQYGPGTFAVPALAAVRHKRVLISRLSGSARDVARKLGVTDRWVRYVRASSRDKIDSRQIDMFHTKELDNGSASD